MDRKEWLTLSSTALASILLIEKVWAKSSEDNFEYLIANADTLIKSNFEDLTFPFDWPVLAIKPNVANIDLSWKKRELTSFNSVFFRITSATDLREEITIELFLKKSKTKVGEMDIRFAHYMQPFEIPLSVNNVELILIEGLTLKITKGTKPFYIFNSSPNIKDIPKEFLPHLLFTKSSSNNNEWRNRLQSIASISTFGWMEGCVLDGLRDLTKESSLAKEIFTQHLNKYFSNDTLVYEAYNNRRSFEKINTVESILPFALLSIVNVHHKVLKEALDFCIDHADSLGVIADEKGANRRLKTEECYTISYPLAILAKQLQQPDLEKLAIANLSARVSLLINEDAIYQNSKELGIPEYKNWARGAGWYLLGMAKSLAILPLNQETKQLRTAFKKGADIVLKYQQNDGLWSNFLHQPETGIDTSGSACIAAALAFGFSKNLLPRSAQIAAYKSWEGLQPYFTVDGFLKGTAQVNKGGEALQRNGFRVISPYTLGFLAVLDNSLKTIK